MVVVCSVCKVVTEHRPPYEDKGVIRSCCDSCYKILLDCDFNYYLQYDGPNVTIVPHKLTIRRLL